jgi:glycosyltransferase involved in cell wall biosynthesis
MKVLIVGPSIERSKGGMGTVIHEHLRSAIINKENKLSYLISHVDGNVFIKTLYAIKSLVYILINQKKYQVIHFHVGCAASFYRKSIFLRVSKWFNKKTIFHIHGHDFDSFYLKNKTVNKNYIRNTLNKGDKILVLSEYWQRFFKKEFKNINVDILPNGIDVDEFEVCIKKNNAFNTFLFLGRLEKRKGVYDLIKAIDIVVNSYNRKELIFYLAGDGEIDKVKKIIHDRKLSDNIKVLGWLNKDEKKKMLRESDVVVLPSYDENLPMSLIEAMSCGKIIISTYAGGIPDLVKHDFNGFLFNAGDIQQLVNYILFVNDNPDKMRSVSANNIETITQHFNLETLSLKLNSIYNSL